MTGAWAAGAAQVRLLRANGYGTSSAILQNAVIRARAARQREHPCPDIVTLEEQGIHYWDR